MSRTTRVRWPPAETLALDGLGGATVIEASAPGRIDCCGSWDLQAFVLPFERYSPVAVNIALDIRNRVRLFAFTPGSLSISSGGECVQGHPESIPLRGPLALPAAILCHFGVTGARLEIQAGIPIGSGLGGSGALAVATIGAVAKAYHVVRGERRIARAAIPLLASRLEEHVGSCLTGLQDQLAASYGGANLWAWTYSRLERPFKRLSLLDRDSYCDVEQRLAIAFSGESRSSADISLSDVQGFLAGSTRSQWFEMLTQIRDFGEAIRAHRWKAAVRTLAAYSALRDRIGPDLWPPMSAKLRDSARALGCAACTGGGNRGGCIWAFGSPHSVLRLREKWRQIAEKHPQVRLMNPRIATQGLKLVVHK